jgi:hypothetical protein
MGAHDGGIDQETLAIALSCERFEESREGAGLRPSREARIHGFPGTVRAREIAPWRPRPKDPEHPLEDEAVRPRWTTTRRRLLRKQRLDALPLRV